MHDYHLKYGSVFRVTIGEVNAVFVSSAAGIRTVFEHEGKYPKHILPPSWLYYNQKRNVERGLLFM